MLENAFVTVRVMQDSDADAFLKRTLYDIRSLCFDGTVVYSYRNTL